MEAQQESKFSDHWIVKLIEQSNYNPQKNLLVRMYAECKKTNVRPKLNSFSINGKKYLLLEDDNVKLVFGDDYNSLFLKKEQFGLPCGFFQRWGKTIEDDPQFSPIGPEILDLEISVNGCPPVGNGGNCKFCYKNNTNSPPTNMSFDTFKTIIDKIPSTLTQVAFGITGVQTNPDFIRMMEYCRTKGIIPNFTLSGADLTDELADIISKLAGAVAVSCYESDKNVCYNTIQKFTSRGMKQVNIHIMVSEETLPFVYEVVKNRINDPRLSKMHAIVFLGIKPKGRAKGKFHSVNTEEYSKLIKTCLDNSLVFGFDSCSAPKFQNSLGSLNFKDERLQKMIEFSEPCESDLFSSYINVFGEFWHCSFSENEEGQESIDVLKANDFLQDVWYSGVVNKFRQKSIESGVNGCRKCTVFPEINN